MRKAFTILELLAATALTAVLMTAVLKVVGSLGRSRAALALHADVAPWRADLFDTIRRDLSNSAQANFRPDGMVLIGHGAIDPATMSTIDQPVTVTYRLADVDGHCWLVRTQAARGGPTDAPAWSELLCPDVAAFTVRPVGGLADATTAAGANANQTVPAVVLVRLDETSGPPVTETLVLR